VPDRLFIKRAVSDSREWTYHGSRDASKWPYLPVAVVSPLSEYSSRVRVQGQLIGATVDLFANGIHVGSVAAWPAQVFPIEWRSDVDARLECHRNAFFNTLLHVPPHRVDTTLHHWECFV
jgi:hypothetical protein